MRLMASFPSLISSISDYIRRTGDHYAGRQALARWARSEPALAEHKTLGQLVAFARNAPGPEQDKLVGAVLRGAGADELGGLTAIAAVSRQLGAVLAAWRRGGADMAQLRHLEADLVTECWVVVTQWSERAARGEPLPSPLTLAIVGEARHRVRTPLRRELRRSAKNVGLDHLDNVSAPAPRSVPELLCREIGSAVRAGRISAVAAKPVLLTRALGYSTSEVGALLGCSAATVRAVRSRAERSLVA